MLSFRAAAMEMSTSSSKGKLTLRACKSTNLAFFFVMFTSEKKKKIVKRDGTIFKYLRQLSLE